MTWTDRTYGGLARLIGARTGLVFPTERQDVAEQAMRRAMMRTGDSDPEHYYHRIVSDPETFDDLIAELTVGETYFFREPDQFRVLRHQWIPNLRARKKPGQMIRAWSAGCASGEEAYSLAILFEEEGLADRTQLLATDLSRKAIAKARNATFTAWSLRGEGMAARPYLSPRGDRFVLDDRIRRRVVFEYLNLATDIYPSFATATRSMDLILCRNVLIYFGPETVRAVAGRLYEALTPGGWLITASSDPPLSGYAPFEIVVTQAGIFYQRPLSTTFTGLDVATQTVAPGFPELNEVEAQGDTSEFARRGSYRSGEEMSSEVIAPSRHESPGDNIREVAQAGNSLLERAREALSRGDYSRAATLACEVGDATAAVVHVQALANVDLADAERVCAEAVMRHRLSAELHYLHSVLLLDLGRLDEAALSARRIIYLDRSLALAHFTLGTILQRRGDLSGALRAYRIARDLCATRASDSVVPLSDDETAGRLAATAAAQVAALEAVGVMA